MLKKIILILFLITGFCYTTPVTTTYSSLDYSLQNTVTKAGDTNLIAFHLSHLDQWHSYWKNPGESGLKTTITWHLPDLISASDIIWPAPEVFMLGPLVNYGYSDKVSLLVKLSTSSLIKPGSYPIKAKLDWLVCKDSCIPESAEINFDFIISSQTQLSLESNRINEQLLNSTFQEIQLDFSLNDNLITFNLPSSIKNEFDSILFFPDQLNVIDISKDPTVTVKDDSIVISLTSLNSSIKHMSGLLKLDDTYLQIQLTHNSPYFHWMTLIKMALFAFLGGLLLNVMPCVFPVLSLKVLNIVQKSNVELKTIRKQAWAYSIGVIFSFIILVSLLLWLKSIGLAIGWGFQLQDPFIVFSLFLLFIFVGLNLNSILHTPHFILKTSGAVSSTYNKLTSDGLLKDFFTGVLAVIVATPCTAPLMAPAIGFALTQSNITAIIIFLMLGFGFCFPFLIIAYVPFLQTILPKPGSWMITFKHILAAFLYASAAWLAYILNEQLQSHILLYCLAIVIIIVVSLLGSQKIKYLKNKSYLILAVLTLISVVIFKSYFSSTHLQLHSSDKTLNLIDTYKDSQKHILVDVTAAWCITCKVNEKLVLNTKEIQTFLDKENITFVTLDWTNYDENITKYLESFDRQGVPLYVFYGDNGTIKILPQLLKKQDIYNLKEKL